MGVVRGAEEEGLNNQVVPFKSPADPRNARNAAGIHGFCAAVPSAESATNLVAAGGVARGWDPEFESALLQQRTISAAF